jgi:monoamine oxidase
MIEREVIEACDKQTARWATNKLPPRRNRRYQDSTVRGLCSYSLSQVNNTHIQARLTHLYAAVELIGVRASVAILREEGVKQQLREGAADRGAAAVLCQPFQQVVHRDDLVEVHAADRLDLLCIA